MTNEQAISHIKDIICENNTVRHSDMVVFEEEKKALYKAIQALEQMKEGHWIADVDKWGDIVTTVNGYRCSECGEFNSCHDNFCPNCGARMGVNE